MARLKFIGLTWRDMNTGKCKTQKTASLMMLARLIAAPPESLSKGILLLRITGVCALITVALIAGLLWMEGWGFTFHTAKFWKDLAGVLVR